MGQSYIAAGKQKLHGFEACDNICQSAWHRCHMPAKPAATNSVPNPLTELMVYMRGYNVMYQA